jgi:hypothetical protein
MEKPMTRLHNGSKSLADRLAHALERCLGVWMRPKPQPVPARVYRSGVQRVPPRYR